MDKDQRIKELEAALVQAQGGFNHFLFERKLGDQYNVESQYLMRNLANGIVIWPKGTKPGEEHKYVSWLVASIYDIQENPDFLDEFCAETIRRFESPDCKVYKPGGYIEWDAVEFSPKGRTYRGGNVGHRYGKYVKIEAEPVAANTLGRPD